jgi:aspartyl-tRNA(Asn)/glutamyl-tRNA(Gln) amidotransferase subunit B
MKEHGLMMVSDIGAIEAAVVEVLAECANVVEDYYSGKDRAFGYLVGQVMKKMRGNGDPGKINEILKEKLER